MSAAPLGRVEAQRIRHMDLPALSVDIAERFQRLSDLTGTISDVFDLLGIRCVVAAAELRPICGSGRIVGPALTIRNVHRNVEGYKAVTDASNRMGEMEAHNLAKAGDVLVIEGLTGVSNMGGQSASIGRRQGEIGAVIDGSIRDPDHYARLGWPVWCRGFTPVTGKWRLETVEVNGPVEIAGVQCNAGDLVCADAAGICFIPRLSIEKVLAMCEKFEGGDAARQADIDAGASLLELTKRKYK